MLAVALAHHAREEAQHLVARLGAPLSEPSLGKSRLSKSCRREPLGDAGALHAGELARQRLAELRRDEEPTTAVGDAGALLDEARLDEVAQHPVEALLGNAQDIEELGDGEA